MTHPLTRSRCLLFLFMLLLFSPVAAAQAGSPPDPAAAFDLNTVTRVTTTDDGTRTHLRLTGQGSATANASGIDLDLGVLTQADGDTTLTVTPKGDFKRRGKSRVFVGSATAVVESNGAATTFDRVRLVVKFRGKGERLRLIGVIRAKAGPGSDGGGPVPPALLNGKFRGQRIAVDPV